MTKSYYFQKGKDLLENGDYNSAKDIFTECLKLDLKDTEIIFSLAETEFKLGNYHKALYLLTEAEKIKSPENFALLRVQIEREIEKNGDPEKLITVSYIVKNEAETLPKSIASIKNIADEIVVVDTGSEDSTVQIANDLGANVYFFDWINDYSAARNISLKYATSKWILYLDADEELSPESIKIIRQLAEDAKINAGGFYCNIMSEYIKDENEKGLYHGKYPRFIRNIGYPVLNFFGRIHEQISPSLYECGYQQEDSPLVIEHHGYAISNEEMQIKVKGHLVTLSEHVREEPQNGYSWYHLGNTLYQMQRYADSKDILENSLKCGNLSNYLSANTCLLLSRVYEHLGDMKTAFTWSHNALKYINKYEHALIRKAELLQKMGLLDKFIKKP